MAAKQHRRRKKPAPKQKPGPKPSITVEVVRRVSERVAAGLTLALALHAEQVATVNEETWKKAVAGNADFKAIYEGAKAKFLEEAVLRLSQAKELKYLCWLLERRHSEMFRKPDADRVVVNQSVSVGIPDEVLQRAREIAAREHKDHTDGE